MDRFGKKSSSLNVAVLGSWSRASARCRRIDPAKAVRQSPLRHASCCWVPSCGLAAGGNERGTRRSRAVAPALVVWGAVAGPPLAPLRALAKLASPGGPRGPLPSLCHSRAATAPAAVQARQTRPQTCLPRTSHRPRAMLSGIRPAPSFRGGVGGRAAPHYPPPAAGKERGAPPSLRLWAVCFRRKCPSLYKKTTWQTPIDAVVLCS